MKHRVVEPDWRLTEFVERGFGREPQPSTPTQNQAGVDLDEIQQEAERLIKLLNHRQPGLHTWNMLLEECLKGLRKLTNQALGPPT